MYFAENKIYKATSLRLAQGFLMLPKQKSIQFIALLYFNPGRQWVNIQSTRLFTIKNHSQIHYLAQEAIALFYASFLRQNGVF
jgi:hypothetical protein